MTKGEQFGFLGLASTFCKVIASPMKVAELQDLISFSFLPGSEKPGLQKLSLSTRFQDL